MPRTIDSAMLGGLLSNAIVPAFLADLTFATGVTRVWSGVGNLTWNGNTYSGVGSLGAVGDVVEGLQVRAEGTTVMLSGIDSTILNDALSEIQIGAPATLWFALLSQGKILGSPYPLYVGVIDKPTIHTGVTTSTVSLAIENRMMMLQRPTARRYTSADQRYYYPNDCGFQWVEVLNDASFRWGS